MLPPTSNLNEADGAGTVTVLPVRAPLDLPDAALFLGVTPLRLRFLRRLGRGPRVSRPGGGRAAYWQHDLEAYRAQLYRRAGISDSEMRRRLAAVRPQPGPVYPRAPLARAFPVDPFMDMASRDEIVAHLSVIGLRAAILVGLAIVILSHTPVFWRFLRHGPYGDL
ncbi:hypothetical protein AA103196_0500 [Ameyamaea chiangmaiensis NBRC 103196]|uniref:Uncharacterized protein n=1 Tax=Ameyamaea chiangmaiensis TaxID=442969 RepID=A0A850PCL0_9PROT|nr:hypothetical protein [Ameyamaea chiangmaiensis]MBS4074897.1 hypothetical protein [Ameyamaea chiangmaiensis]NVN41874.1 hypothetical protein [Ameyamaea chiangmaiensis]GBQ63145.1 hypothetical protein AA103196_0500 [Ameyamaea chiangmaiensis NBRC 103196]